MTAKGLFLTLCLTILNSSSRACGLTADLLARTETAAVAYGLDTALLASLFWQESRYCHEDFMGQPGITTSSAGALGIGQLMPATAAGMGVNPYDLDENMLGAARYLRAQWDTFGDWRLALAAYNAGPNAVRRAGGVPDNGETPGYVATILASYSRLRATATAPVVTPRSSAVIRRQTNSNSVVIRRNDD